MKISEKKFEDTIEAYLLAFGPDALSAVEIREHGTIDGVFQFGGYHQRSADQYDRERCLIPEDVISFVRASQPKAWEKLRKQYRDQTKDQFVKRLSSEIQSRGTLDVLRNGIKDSGIKFELYYHHPATSLNPEIQKRYLANIFSVVRQLHYSTKDSSKSLDLAIFLNGMPLFTAELKNPLTGQTVQNAITQYRKNRDPREPLFKLGRCLAHFAVDPELVYFTAQLKGEDTVFLPFNQGNNRGAGNPPSYLGYATAYLWEQVWARDSILDLIQNFIYIVEETNEAPSGNTKKVEKVIFPRYHQLESVRRLISDSQNKGPGQRYLIQHSAGSGKSYSISWLAHQLSHLHDENDQRIFDSIIVVTDRRVLDQQLQTHVTAFEQVRGLVETIGKNKTSKDLAIALEKGKNIIVSTIQKFPYIVEEIGKLGGSNFAVIIDEAHSSQGGETSHQMQQVLAAGSLEEAENLESEPQEDWEDRVVAAAQARGLLPNVSYFAFTATPKQKTLELFGTKNDSGEYEPFSLYSMRQAIDEGFILDVLQNYTTYKTYWNLLKKVKDDPRFDRQKATYLLKSFVDLHEATIEKKVAIMLGHFDNQIVQKINGHAKAMIVTRSRLHAVRYKLAVDAYIRENKFPYKALVAFSGMVKDPTDGQTYTEAQMNTRSSGEYIPESATAETFKEDQYRIMVVAEKFQTGFDQPYLHTMYVDKKLNGLHAVQTLSRLNRIHPGKKDVVVLDFVNEAEDIMNAFLPYYDRLVLEGPTDPNILYTYERKIREFALFDDGTLDRFARVYFGTKFDQDQIISTMRPVVNQFEDLEKNEKKRFKDLLRKFTRAYAFIGQIATFSDADLEKLYYFSRYLIRLLPIEPERLPREILDAIDLETLRVEETGSQSINLTRGTVQQKPEGEPGDAQLTENEIELLSKIIRDLNEQFGTEWSDEDHLPVIQQIEEGLDKNLALKNSVMINTADNAKLTFDEVLNDLFQSLIDTNFKFYKQINDDEDLGERFKKILFDRYRNRLGYAGNGG
jgi:type I restriction enzyme R subunit